MAAISHMLETVAYSTDMLSRVGRSSLRGCSLQIPVLVVDQALQPTMRLLLNHQSFHTILLAPDPTLPRIDGQIVVGKFLDL